MNQATTAIKKTLLWEQQRKHEGGGRENRMTVRRVDVKVKVGTEEREREMCEYTFRELGSFVRKMMKREKSDRNRRRENRREREGWRLKV